MTLNQATSYVSGASELTEQLAKKSTGERRRDRRVEEIALAARTLFATRGVTETSMAEIADAVDLSPKALYYYFSSKRALLESVLERGFLHFEPAELAAARARLDGLDLRDALIRSGIDSVEEILSHGDLLKVSFSETFRGNATTQAQHRAYKQNWTEHVKLVLDERSDEHSLPPQRRLSVARTMVYAWFGFSVDKVLQGEHSGASDDVEADSARLVEVVVDALILDALPSRRPRSR